MHLFLWLDNDELSILNSEVQELLKAISSLKLSFDDEETGSVSVSNSPLELIPRNQLIYELTSPDLVTAVFPFVEISSLDVLFISWVTVGRNYCKSHLFLFRICSWSYVN